MEYYSLDNHKFTINIVVSKTIVNVTTQGKALATSALYLKRTNHN